MTVVGADLDRLRNRFVDLVEVHPMQDWSATLLQAVNGVLEMYVQELGLLKRPATVLQLARNQSD